MILWQVQRALFLMILLISMMALSAEARAPKKVKNLQIVPKSFLGYALSWDSKNKDIASLRVEIQRAALGKEYEVVTQQEVGTLAFFDPAKELLYEVPYTYRIRFQNNEGEYSQWVESEAPALQKPVYSQVTRWSLELSEQNDGVTFSWDPEVYPETQIEFKRTLKGAGKEKRFAIPVEVGFFTDLDVVDQSDYVYSCRYLESDRGREGEFGDLKEITVSFKRKEMLPIDLVNFAGRISFKYTKLDDLSTDSYEVQRAINAEPFETIFEGSIDEFSEDQRLYNNREPVQSVFDEERYFYGTRITYRLRVLGDDEWLPSAYKIFDAIYLGEFKYLPLDIQVHYLRNQVGINFSWENFFKVRNPQIQIRKQKTGSSELEIFSVVASEMYFRDTNITDKELYQYEFRYLETEDTTGYRFGSLENIQYQYPFYPKPVITKQEMKGSVVVIEWELPQTQETNPEVQVLRSINGKPFEPLAKTPFNLGRFEDLKIPPHREQQRKFKGKSVWVTACRYQLKVIGDAYLGESEVVETEDILLLTPVLN